MDCACFAYDGSAVYGTPRGLASLLTQVITVDPFHFTPSYAHRLIKYSKRGFELYWPQLDRSLIRSQKFEDIGMNRIRDAQKVLTGDWDDAWLQDISKAAKMVQDWVECRRQAWKSKGLERLLIAEKHPYVFDKNWPCEDRASFNTVKIPWGKKWDAKAVIGWAEAKAVRASDPGEAPSHKTIVVGEMEHIVELITFSKGNSSRLKHKNVDDWTTGAYDDHLVKLRKAVKDNNHEAAVEAGRQFISTGGTTKQIEEVLSRRHTQNLPIKSPMQGPMKGPMNGKRRKEDKEQREVHN